MRRGLLRMYIGISVPWILWWLYRANFDASNYRYRVDRDYFALFALPVSIPLLFLTISWIAEGFGLTHNSPSSDARTRTRFSPDVEKAFGKLLHLFRDEDAQTERLPEPIRSKVRGGASCDQLPGGSGEFGTTVNNPIPVNGPLGGLIYLSNLRVERGGAPLLFHRLGSINDVDLYETVSFDGKDWAILCLDMYHPRKSRRSPNGYKIADDKDRRHVLYGTNVFVEVFPERLPEAISRTYERMLGGKMRPREVREAIENNALRRPESQRLVYESLIKRFYQPDRSDGLNHFGFGRLLGRILLDPEACWADVCKLREYDTPGPVATCEMSFARAAVIRDAVDQVFPDEDGKEIKKGVNKFVEDVLDNEKPTPTTTEHYRTERLGTIASQIIHIYDENVFPLTQLADTLAGRLSVPGVPALEIAPLFQEVATEAVKLLRLFQSSKDIRETLRRLNLPSAWAEAVDPLISAYNLNSQ